jgi:hypothetical protein
MLKESGEQEKIVIEIEKDIARLKLVSDRFGKIGSKPQLLDQNIVLLVQQMVDYIRKRTPGKISIEMNASEPVIMAHVSPPLFEWVIENLLKNALDAMEGIGTITVSVSKIQQRIQIDVTDTGKGIARKDLYKVFKPGFTTKKRGWGLGLSLSNRIVAQYHKGQIYVKQSELGKGTTFRILLQQ